MALSKGNSIVPFWGKSVNMITGLDPLGLQTTSEAIYSYMLPGVTNLTNRIRYYGFYCWLIKFYFEKEIAGSSYHQTIFLRRAELLVAIIMQHELSEIQQITGSNFASGLIVNGLSEYDLAEGADQDGDKPTYWKFYTGAFGQYYFGAMRALSLVVKLANNDGDEIFVVTKPNEFKKVSGLQLAEAFDAGLTEEVKSLFYDCIINGKLNELSIKRLISYFAITDIDLGSKEWVAYQEMLFDQDSPDQDDINKSTYNRRDTIRGILKLSNAVDGIFDWGRYLSNCYHLKMTGNETQIGWYAYQLNEYWQYACGTIFWSLLQDLENLHLDQYLPDFVNEFASQTFDFLQKHLDLKASYSFSLDDILNEITESFDENELIDQIKISHYSDTKEMAGKAFILLFTILNKNNEQLVDVRNFMQDKHILREGDFFTGLSYFETSKELLIKDFLGQFLLKKIINRHQLVALRKMGNGQQSTQKFAIDEQFIRVISVFPPKFTSPRLGAIQNILYDLNVVNESRELSDSWSSLVGT